MKSRHSSYQNLPRIITEALREAILDGDLTAGTRLKQVEIASRFDSSLIPVREALRTLEQEGLVTMYPNKGAVVSGLSPKEAREIFDTRIILELGALELSTPHLLPEDIAECRRLIAQLDEADAGNELSRLNQNLHTRLYRWSGNDYLLQLIATLHSNVERYMRVYLLDHYNNDLSQTYHRQIVDAAADKDNALACRLLRTHMELARDNLLEALTGN